MPFEIVETITKRNTPPMASLSYMRNSRSKKNGTAMPQLQLSIPTTIAGVSKSNVFVMMIGRGTEIGKLLVVGEQASDAPRPMPAHSVRVAQLKHALRWNFGFVPLLGEDIFDCERFPVRRIGDETFEITLPPKFFPEPAEPAAPTGKETRASSPPPKHRR